MRTSPAPDLECGIAGICKTFGLTARAVRLYEDEGLVRVRRDDHNQRRYGREARGRLQLISLLRGVGLGVPEIRALLDAQVRDDDQRRRMIADAVAARLAHLEAEVAQARAVLVELQPGRFGSTAGALPVPLAHVA